MNRPLPSALTVYLLFLTVILLQAPLALVLQERILWVGILASQLCAIALPTLLLTWWRHYEWRVVFPLRCPTVGGVLIVIVLTIGVTTLTHYAVEWTQATFHTPPLLEERLPELVTVASPAEAVVKVLLIALLPAIIEEGFFRGFCQSALSRAYSARIGWIVSAFLFAAAHNNLAYLHLYLALGLYLGFLRIRSNSLWLPILAHAVNNGWTIWLRAH